MICKRLASFFVPLGPLSFYEMNYRALLISLTLLFLSGCAASRYARGPETEEIESALSHYDGTVRMVCYPSGEPHLSERRMTVYLPANYEVDRERRFPVMYLLHGARGNEVTWIERGDVLMTLDSLSRLGAVEDFILVLPNVNNYFSDKEYNNGHAIQAVRAFWIVDGETEVHFMQDVVNTVDSLFRTVQAPEGRAIAGMSTGGLQAMYLAANHPDSFGYVGLFSPYAYDTVFGLRHPEFYGGIWRKLDRQFETPPEYYGIMIGRKDFFLPHMTAVDRKMTRLGYGHEFIVSPGGHKWGNWRKYFIYFSQKAFR